MHFYVLSKPDSGGLSHRWMPLDELADPFEARMPAIRCGVCGRTWKSTSRLPEVQVKRGSRAYQLIQRSPVDPTRYRQIVAELGDTLKLPGDLPLLPGTTLGTACASFTRTHDLPDFVWSWAGYLLISLKARLVLREARLTGFTTLPVNVMVPSGEDVAEAESYEEFVITGNAGLAVTDDDYKIVAECSACGYVSRNVPRSVSLSESAWDGSDFCRFSGPLNPRLVSERAKRVIEESGLTNVSFRGLDTLCQQL